MDLEIQKAVGRRLVPWHMLLVAIVSPSLHSCAAVELEEAVLEAQTTLEFMLSCRIDRSQFDFGNDTPDPVHDEKPNYPLNRTDSTTSLQEELSVQSEGHCHSSLEYDWSLGLVLSEELQRLTHSESGEGIIAVCSLVGYEYSNMSQRYVRYDDVFVHIAKAHVVGMMYKYSFNNSIDSRVLTQWFGRLQFEQGIICSSNE